MWQTGLQTGWLVFLQPYSALFGIADQSDTHANCMTLCMSLDLSHYLEGLFCCCFIFPVLIYGGNWLCRKETYMGNMVYGSLLVATAKKKSELSATRMLFPNAAQYYNFWCKMSLEVPNDGFPGSSCSTVGLPYFPQCHPVFHCLTCLGTHQWLTCKMDKWDAMRMWPKGLEKSETKDTCPFWDQNFT